MRKTLRFIVAVLCVTSAEVQAQSTADRADVAWRSGNTAEAKRLYDAVLAADSTDGTALHRVALLHAWAKRYDDSLRLLELLLRLEPQNRDARVDRARVLAWSGRTGAAMAVADSLISTHPTDANALRLRAQLLGWQGRLVESETLWRSLLRDAPDNVDLLTGFAQTLRWQGRDAAALEQLERATQLAPDHADARDQMREVRLTMAPRTAPAITYESDSDENRIVTMSISAATRLQPRLEVRADGYSRNTEVAGDGTSARAYGATAGVRIQLEQGWWISAGAGATASDVPDADVFPALRASLTTPRRYRTNGAITVARAALDASSALISRQIYTDEIGVEAETTLGGVTISAAAGGARFHSRVSGSSNRRWHSHTALTRAVSSAVTLGVRARAFGFEQDLNDGYFDPDFYGLAELTGRISREIRRVTILLEGAPGIQQVRSGEPATGAYRMSGQTMYTFSPGRSIGIQATFAKSGLQQLSQSVGSDYTYRALGISAGWVF